MAYGEYVKITWDVEPEKMLNDGIRQYTKYVHSQIYQICKEWEPKIVGWMQSNAPWTDRSGEARAGLKSKGHILFGQYVILRLSHTVDYGTYLEGWNPLTNAPMNNAGRWSILEPALDIFGPQIMADVKHRLGLT